MLPGVPASLSRPMGNAVVNVQPVSLPVEAFYPLLRPEMTAGLIAQAEAGVKQAVDNVQKAKDAVVAAQRKVDVLEARLAKRPDATPPVRPSERGEQKGAP